MPVAAERHPAARARAITDRDMRILGWLGRFPAGATVRQVARRFEMGENRAYRRLKQLAGAGLARYEKLLHPKPGGVYVPTAEGLAVAGVELAPPRADLGTHIHDLAVVEAAVNCELAGAEVLTERELRAAWPEGGGPYAFAGSFPDLVVLEGDKRSVVEVKTGDVPRPQLERQLAEYAAAATGQFDRVLVAGNRPEVGERVAAIADELEAEIGWELVDPSG